MATRCRWCQRDVAPDGARIQFAEAAIGFPEIDTAPCARAVMAIAARSVVKDEKHRAFFVCVLVGIGGVGRKRHSPAPARLELYAANPRLGIRSRRKPNAAASYHF